MDSILAVLIGGFVLSIISLVLVLYFFYDHKRSYSGITRLSEILEDRLSDEDSATMLHDAIDSFYHLGALAQNANAIMSDEETFDGLLTEFAGRVRKSIVGSIMGTASGDVKKRAHAERLLNNAMIDGAQKMNPMLGMLLKVTGLDEELREDPELLGYILQIISEKGLLNMFDSSMLSLPSTEQQRVVKEHLGIDF